MGYAVASGGGAQIKEYTAAELSVETFNALAATFNTNVFTFRATTIGKLCLIEFGFSIHFTDAATQGMLITLPKELNPSNVLAYQPSTGILNGQTGKLDSVDLSPDPDTPQLNITTGDLSNLTPTDVTYYGQLFFKLA